MKLSFALFASAAFFLISYASAEPEIFDEEEILTSSPTLNDETQEATTTTTDVWLDEAMRRHIVLDQFIVIFDGKRVTNATETGLRLVAAHGDENTELVWSYHVAFRGVTMRGVNPGMLKAMAQDPDVEYFEPDIIVRLDSHLFKQRNPPNWGLDRIDELLIGVAKDEKVKAFDGYYKFDQTGDGVVVFVVDTGVRPLHADFVGDGFNTRITCGYDSYHLHHHEDALKSGCHDGVGHGTHVAGVIGGSLYGVAKDVVMVSVKTFTDAGSGSIGSVLSGLDFILRSRAQNSDLPMVVNMAFGTEADSIPMDLTIASMAEAGLIMTASAGNEGHDACTKTPAKYKEVITVGATTVEDGIATFSNKGGCVDIFAPGDRITSDWCESEADRATISGTSAASAHAAGVAALVLQKYAQMQPDQMKKALQMHSEINAVHGIADDDDDTPNLLLNMALLSV